MPQIDSVSGPAPGQRQAPEISAVHTLGIDPGYRRTGYGMIRSDLRSSHFVCCGHIDSGSGGVGERLGRIFREISAIIARYRPDVVSVEEVFVNRNAATSLKLGQARGAAITAAVDAGLPVVEYAATRIKQNITGNGHAPKSRVEYMVRRLLNMSSEPLGSDAVDALAAAICHINQQSGLARVADAAVPALRIRRRRR